MLAVAYVAHMGTLLKHSVSKSSQESLFSQRMSEKNKSIPEIKLIDFLDNHVEESGVVLSLKPADMYYSSRRMMSFLDERLLSFYGKKDIDSAYDELRKFGITHVHIPSYGIPPIYNSQLFSLLRNPNYTTLRYQTTAGQIYTLIPEASSKRGGALPIPGTRRFTNTMQQDISPKNMQWVRQDVFSLGGRKIFIKWGERNSLLTEASYRRDLPYDLFHRHWRTIASVGIALPNMLPAENSILHVEPSREYAIDLRLAGAGFLEISVDQFAKQEEHDAYELIKHTEITSFELSENQPMRDYGFRFLTEPTAQAMVLNIKSMGSSAVEIVTAVKSKIEEN